MTRLVTTSFFIGIVLLLPIVSEAQESTRTIYWNGQPQCELLNFKDGNSASGISCDSFYSDGSMIWIFRNNGLAVAANVTDNGAYYSVELYLKNETSGRILIDPSTVQIAVKTSTKPNAKVELLEPISGNQIARKLQSSANWANFFGAWNANVNGNAGTQIVEGLRAADRNETASSVGASYIDVELRTNTVFPNTDIGGQVFFKRKKKVKAGAVKFEIEGVRYVFEFSMGEK